MPDNETSIEIFLDDYGGVDGIALVIKNPSIVEYENELTPSCKLTPQHARVLAAALMRCAKQIED